MSIVEAARILQNEGESRVRFVLTGGGAPNAEWRRVARDVQSVTCLNWLGHGEIERLLARAHVGLVQITGDVTRFWLGNKFYDYLSSFLCLINNVPGEAAGIVNDRQLGLNIPPKDPNALAAAIRSLLADPSRVRFYMENAQSAFTSEFDRRRIHDQFLAYLRRHLTRGWDS
ncbi:MAG: glycosyltransferase [Gemmatimonadaceae bacterium]